METWYYNKKQVVVLRLETLSYLERIIFPGVIFRLYFITTEVSNFCLKKWTTKTR